MESNTINIWKRLQTGFPRMHRTKRLRVSEVNPHLICVLCGGYYIDATTITECLHTFCKTCIVGYLEASKHCPVCDNLVHKTKPHLRLRSDHTLQDLVYKLVPGLFQDEMRKRREFYKEEIEDGKLGEDGIPEERERIIYSADEQISLILELSPNGTPPFNPGHRSSKHHRLEAADRRYLQCPANITVGHLKKFIKMKFNLCDRFQLDFYHTDETLRDTYTLVDIAYIYSWRRKGPLRLYYSVFTNPAKKFKGEATETVPMETDVTLNNSDLKTETSGYVTDEDKLNNDMDTSTDSINARGSGSDSFELDTSDPESFQESSKKVTPAKVDSDNQNECNGDKGAHETTIENDKLDKCSKSSSETKLSESKTDTSETKLDTTEHSSTSDGEKTDVKSETDTDLKESNLPVTDTANIVHDTKVANAHDDNIANKEETTIKSNLSNVQFQKKVDTKSEQLQVAEQSDVPNIIPDKTNAPDSPKPNTTESSTSTSSVTTKDAKLIQSNVPKQSKLTIKDDDVSEPVVSSTQNTQGCQTEPPESSADMLELPHSSDVNTSHTESPTYKSTVDVSCETDNIALARQISKESVSVSVSTETDVDTSNEKQTLVDCSTDASDIPHSDTSKKKTVDVDCSTEFEGYPTDSSKRKSLTVDCSTDMDDIEMASNKRKSIDCAIMTENKGIKKTEYKAPKRSISYSGHLTTKTAYLAQPLSPTKITLKCTPPKSPGKITPKSPSRAEPSGFQSQYQSFVMELPDKTYEFEDETPQRVEPTTSSSKLNDSYYKQHTYSSISQAYTGNKSLSKTGRPRGRPPKNKPHDNIAPPKEKKHKSRSHSPKYRKHGDKSNDVFKVKRVENSSEKRNKSAQSQGGEQINSTTSTAYSWINKLGSNNKVSSEQKKQKSKSVSLYEKSNQNLKIPKQFLYFSNGQYTLASASTLNSLKQSSPLSPTRTVSTSEYIEKYSKGEKSSSKKGGKIEKNEKERTETKPVNTEECVTKHTSTTSITDKQYVAASHTTDTNQNKIVTSSTSTVIPKVNVSDTNDKHIPACTKVPFPEYRHQSPFFASIIGAKLGTVHRPSTHLNIPNPSSHFSGMHHLYTQGRYSSERLGTPIYRSLSVNDKSPSSPVSSKLQDRQRMDTVSSPLGFMPFSSPYLGLAHMHNHMVNSMPPSLSPKGYSPDSTKSPSSRVSSSPTNLSSSASQNNAKNAAKTNCVSRKGKEKSIDNIISAITEMRTKKETSTQEQLNGIDLSTKGSRQAAEKSPNTYTSEEKVDRFAFTDDDDVQVASQKIQFKPEHVPSTSAV